jgi:hypothetical protein
MFTLQRVTCRDLQSLARMIEIPPPCTLGGWVGYYNYVELYSYLSFPTLSASSCSLTVQTATANLWYKSFCLNLEPQFRLRTADVLVRKSLVTAARVSRSRLHCSSEQPKHKHLLDHIIDLYSSTIFI